ncbi:hypothetical protein [Caulobacter segnis]
MRITAPVYPGGSLGAGLAVLRLSLAWATLTFDPIPELGGLGAWLTAVLCVSLALGAGARWSALVCALALVVFGAPASVPRDLAVLGAMVALALAGPGAYAVDARIWGRVRVRSRSSR